MLKPQIIALRAAAKLGSVSESAALPTLLLVLPWGTNDTAHGAVTCNATTLSSLPANDFPTCVGMDRNM